MTAQNFDIFSSLKDDAFLVLLLFVGPLPSDIVRLSVASPFVRNRLSTDSFCRKFLSLYLNVVTLTDRKISWCKELKKWLKLRNDLSHCKIDIQGQEMKEICNAGGKSTYKIALRSNGIVRLSHLMPMAPRTRVLLTNLFNEFPQEGLIFQPSGSFPFLPLSGCPSMYYEVKIAKSVPSFGGPVIGYALPSLCSALPGLSRCSFGVSLGQLLGLHGEHDHADLILSPRGETFALRKGDVFGVGLIHNLTPELPSYYHQCFNNPEEYRRAHNADFAVFYVTFNGKLIYSTVGDCYFRLVPTIVLTTYGDVVDVNFGAETSPSGFFSANGFEVLKTFNEHLTPFKFYKSSWKYNPLEALQYFDTELSSKVKDNLKILHRLKSLNQPKHYWCSLHDIDQFVPVASEELIWYGFLTDLDHYQNLRDFLSRLELPQWAKISKLMTQSFELQHLLTLSEGAEISKDQVMRYLQDETYLEDFSDAADTNGWVYVFAGGQKIRLTREIGLQLISLINAGCVPFKFHRLLLNHLIASDYYIFELEKERYDDDWLTLIKDESGTMNIFARIFVEARKLLQKPNFYLSTRPFEVHQELFSAALSFRSFGLLPQNAQALTKEQVSQIYQSLNDDQRRELRIATLCFFIDSRHFLDETNWPTSAYTPWVPTTSVEAIHVALTSLTNQRNKARNCDASSTQDRILTFVGSVYNLLCFVEDPESYLETVNEDTLKASFPSSYEYHFQDLAQCIMSPYKFYKECDAETFSKVAKMVEEYWDAHCCVSSFWFGEEILVDTMCSSEHFPYLSPEVLLKFKRGRSNFSLQPFLTYGGIITAAAALLVGSAIALRYAKKMLNKSSN